MEKWHIALVAISIYLVLAFLIGIMAGKGKSFFSLSEYAVGDRSFNLFVMWFLMGGTIFSAFAFLGGPGWAYSKGAASFYILVYCTLGLMPWYVIGPKVAKIGKKNNHSFNERDKGWPYIVNFSDHTIFSDIFSLKSK